MNVPGIRQVGSCGLSTDILCDPCKGEDEEENAVFFCTVCNEFFCDSCNKAHRRAKLSKHHHILDRDSMPQQTFSSEESMCTKHKGKIVEYYCKIHDEYCCFVCSIIKHNTCTVDCIDDIATGFVNSGEYKYLMSTIADLTQQLQHTKNITLTKRYDVSQIHMKFVSEVKKSRSEINQILDCLEQNTLEEAQTVKDTYTKSTESASTACNAKIADLEQISRTMEKQKKYKQQRQLVLSAKKAQSQIKQYDRLNVEFNNQCTIQEYYFRSNENILHSVKAVNSLGQLVSRKKDENLTHINILPENKSEQSQSVSFRYVDEVDIQHYTDTDYENSSMTSVDFKNSKVISCIHLPSRPWDIARVDINKVVVTCDNKPVFIKVGKKVLVLKEVDMGCACLGIVYTNNTLIVSCLSPGCITIVDLDGHILKTITADKQGHKLFRTPCYIALSADQKTLYVSDKCENSVTSMDLDGNVQHVYKHAKLMTPSGLLIDKEGNIYIPGCWSNNLHIISPQCTTVNVIKDETSGMDSPWAVIHGERDNQLHISQHNGFDKHVNISVSAYQIQ